MSAYRAMQEVWARDWLMPWIGFHPGRVLDLGCGDGGVAVAFWRRGSRVDGHDITEHDWPVESDVDACPDSGLILCQWDIRESDGGGGDYDLIVLRDVLEHTGRKADVLANARQNLASDGRIFVSFPPYWSPYGGHQQSELRGWWRFLPWLHRHPQLRHIRETGLTMRHFESLARDCGLRVVKKRSFLVRPFVAVRYGLPVVGGRGGELFTGGAWYLLAEEGDDAD